MLNIVETLCTVPVGSGGVLSLLLTMTSSMGWGQTLTDPPFLWQHKTCQRCHTIFIYTVSFSPPKSVHHTGLMDPEQDGNSSFKAVFMGQKQDGEAGTRKDL